MDGEPRSLFLFSRRPTPRTPVWVLRSLLVPDEVESKTRRVIMSTRLTIPDDILVAAGITEGECLIELAIQLYAQRRIKIGHALRLSQLTRQEFEKELARHNVNLYSVDDLIDDVASLKELGRL